MRYGFFAFFLAVLIVSSVGYAFPMGGAVSTVVSAKVGPMHGAAEMNAEVNVPATPKPVISIHHRVRAVMRHKYKIGMEFNHASPRVVSILEKHFGAKRLAELNRTGRLPQILAAIAAHREHALRELRAHPDVVRHWVQVTRMYQRAVLQLRQHMALFQQKRSRWEHYHELYVRGEIDENTYFNVSKDFVLSAIDTTIARLEAMSGVADVNLDVNATIAKLRELRAEVDSAKDLNQLRTIYSQQVLPELRDVNQKLFTRMYLLATIRATNSIVARLDIAAARLTEYQEFVASKGAADEEFNAQIDAIFAEISNVQSELNALKSDVASGKITNVHQYIERIKQIKQDVVRIYHDIRSLMAQYNEQLAHRTPKGSMHVEGRASASVTGAEQNAGVTAEANVEVNA